MPELVAPPVRGVGELVQEPEGVDHRCQNPQTDPMVACFDSLQGRPGRERAIGHYLHRQASSPARILKIGAELLERPSDRGGWMVWSGHEWDSS